MSILYSVDNGVATLQIARPERKNALTQDMYQAMARALATATGDDAVRSLLITGQDGVFTSGNELTEFLEHPELTEDTPVIRFMLALARFEKPVIAAVNGPAVGIGATLLLHCDLVYLAASARLTMPFVRLGLVPEFAASLLLPLRAGRVRAAEALLLGSPISAEGAVQMGLANMVVPDEQVLDVAREAALRFNRLPAGAVRETKRLMQSAQVPQVEAAILGEARVFGARLGGPEVREAVAAFFAGREPDFSGEDRED